MTGAARVAHVFAEHSFDPPLAPAELHAMAASARHAALEGHGVRWRESLLDSRGRHLLARFEAPSEAAVRAALRSHGGPLLDALWTGTVREMRLVSPSERRRLGPAARIMAGRRLPAPLTLADVGAIESACGWCFAAHRVELVRVLLSTDLHRVVYLYRAPDAESVRLAHRQAGLRHDFVRPYRELDGWLPAARASVAPMRVQ